MPLHHERQNAFSYEIRGALPVRPDFRRVHRDEFVGSLPDPSSAYCAMDSVTRTCLICLYCPYPDSPEVEDALVRFADRWASAGAIFYRQCMGEMSFFPIGLRAHVDLLARLDATRIQRARENANTTLVRARIRDELRELSDDEASFSPPQNRDDHA